jgi:hypothetical protein
MAGKGNINASKHPWATYWSRRALKKEDRWILRFVRPYRDSLLSDKADATEGEQRMIEIASAARVAWMLALTRGEWKAVSRFQTVEQRSLVAIGLDRRAREIGGDLKTYLKALAKPEADGLPSDS